MHYTVNSKGYRLWEVYDDAGSLVGTMAQNAWRPLRAEITVGDTVYRVAPTGFWQTTMAVTRDEHPIAEIKFTMSGGLKINFTTAASIYRFRYKNFWHTSYAIADEYGQEIASIQVHFNWKTWKNDYAIEVLPNTLDKEMNTLLPLLMIYCVRYTRVLMSAG